MSAKIDNGSSAPNIPALPQYVKPRPTVIFTDVDDTLTHDGQLPVETFIALSNLKLAGISVVPVTGASAGWCDCMIKTWPISHIIGENGALSMEKNNQGIVCVRFAKAIEASQSDFSNLQQIGSELIKRFPAIAFTQDQAFRVTDVAFDIGQTVTVDEATIQEATNWLTSQGVQARRSSIHINAWLGNHSKATGAVNWLQKRFIDEHHCMFIGDSPNDESMFKQFPLSVGVANIARFLPMMTSLPTYLTASPGGYGFVELANALIGDKNAER